MVELPAVVDVAGHGGVTHIDGRGEICLGIGVRISHVDHGRGIDATAQISGSCIAKVARRAGIRAANKLRRTVRRGSILEVAVGGIKGEFPLRVRTGICNTVVGASLPVHAKLEEVVALLPAQVVLQNGIDLLCPDLVVVEAARHEQIGIAVSSSVGDRRDGIIAAVLVHTQVVEVAVAAVVGIHVEPAGGKGDPILPGRLTNDMAASNSLVRLEPNERVYRAARMLEISPVVTLPG